MKRKDYVKLFDTEPCKEAKDWLLTQNTLREAWENCERGDWLWWALVHSDSRITKQDCINFAQSCAMRAKSYAAYAAADAAAYAAADAAYADAAYAAYTAAAADAYAAYANAAVYAANAAAYAAADAYAAYANAAAYAAYVAAADAAERKLQADWIRENIKYPF